MTIIDGKELAADVLDELKQNITDLKLKPGLGIVLVGTNAGSEIYVRNKVKAAQEVGIRVQLIQLAAEASKEKILAAVHALNADTSVHGIIVQLPLPRPEEADEIIAAIDTRKDVDGYHPATLEALRKGDREHIPVMGRVILDMLGSFEIDRKQVVIVARNPSFIEGLKLLLEELGTTVMSAAPDQADLGAVTRTADILIAAGNTENLITADMVKDKAIIIDIGIMKNAVGKTVGCVDFEHVSPKCRAMTPVPGGVGPLTVAYLLWNTVLASITTS
jgi:methylenetetrahydrofolate dehydrogenase (NADP+)/methenyltetrahydrofolate cyclohydrolase